MNAHGKVSLTWVDDLLTISAEGPFNELGMQNSISKIQKSILDRGMKSWRKIEIWDGETLGSPDVVESARVVSQWYKKNGCCASAIVINNCIQQALIDSLNTGGTMAFYEITAAKKWLDEQST
jgi:hypothetical protein